MKDIGIVLMLLLLAVPFVALVSDAVGRTDDLLDRALPEVFLLTWVVYFLVGGFERSPNVAYLFGLAFLVWPVPVLIAKGFNPQMSWSSIATSVVVMSWFATTAVIMLGRSVAPPVRDLVFGWPLTLVPFAICSGMFLTGRALIRWLRRQIGMRGGKDLTEGGAGGRR